MTSSADWKKNTRWEMFKIYTINVVTRIKVTKYGIKTNKAFIPLRRSL